MRLFQFTTFGNYLPYFNDKFPEAREYLYQERLNLLINQSYAGLHILDPILKNHEYARYTVADDTILQEQWAREAGIKSQNIVGILLAQIEDHKTEVLYTLSPILFDSSFVRRLPGCVRKTICWRAAPHGNADLSAYDLRVCNFPVFIKDWNSKGMRAAWFCPSYDPAMEKYSRNVDRPIDISFVGGFSRKHLLRNQILRKIAALSERYNLEIHLTYASWIKTLNMIPFATSVFSGLELPERLLRINHPPVFGLDLYDLFSRSKIVFNGAIDMAREYRGNMRCFEVMGCGAIMLSDEGIYPDGFIPGTHFIVYKNKTDVIPKVVEILENYEEHKSKGFAGAYMLKSKYSKEWQWSLFQKLVDDLG